MSIPAGRCARKRRLGCRDGAGLCSRRARSGPWEFDADNAKYLADKRESRFLPDVGFDERIKLTRGADRSGSERRDLAGVLAQALRSVPKSLAHVKNAKAPLVVCAKGIERGTN